MALSLLCRGPREQRRKKGGAVPALIYLALGDHGVSHIDAVLVSFTSLVSETFFSESNIRALKLFQSRSHTPTHHGQPAVHAQLAQGGDSTGLTCPLCPQELWARMYPPHTKGPRETKISWGHRGKLVFWTKSSRPGHVSKKIKQDTTCA